MAQEDELKKEKTYQRMERLRKAVAYLISIDRISQKSTQKDIAEQMGYNNKVTISNALNGNIRYLTESFINRFCDTFNNIFNLNWLLDGEGEMLKNTTPKPLYAEAVPIQTDVVYIPLVNQYAYAGYLDGYSDVTYVDQLPKIPFIVDQEGHGNYIAFEVKGDSMNDGTEESYLEGDRLYCREIQPHLWVNSKLHLRKWDFVIVHEDGIVVKRILDHDVENHTITIHSLNDMYPDRVIDLCDVRQIFNVIESVRPRRR